MKKKLFSLMIVLLALVGSSYAQQDSVIVLKGQIADYVVSSAKPYTVSGYIRDTEGNPVEGATVMFVASPAHDNSDAKGYYEVPASIYDSTMVVYALGKEIVYSSFRDKGGKVDLVMPAAAPRTFITPAPGIATRWFDPLNDQPHTYCNPVNLSYSFRAMLPDLIKNGSFRSSADPIIIRYKGEYLIFSTNQGGFYWSKDLAKWNFVPASFQRYPQDDDQCAPAAFVVGDTLFYTGSTYRGLPMWYSTDPKSGKFKRYVDKTFLPSWDPGFLIDDDGRAYLYYGSSNEFPLKGVEVSRSDYFPISNVQDIMKLHPDKYGWERFGMNNDDMTTLPPFTEGAWVNKHNGKYYFQYGAPGTEFKTYADGVYVSDTPLGPFTYQKHNPMSYKPGGFVQGAGHGGTSEDNFGNHWHIATCMLSIKYKFERRIGLYPSGFDQEGVMYCNTSFGDYPICIPTGPADHTQGKFSGWMLLSYRKSVSASSTDAPELGAQNASDENMRTFWSAKSGNAGEWFQMDLGKPMEVRAIQLNYYDHKAVQHNRAHDLYHQYKIYASADGVQWELIVDKSDNDLDVPHDYVELKEPLQTRYLKLENIHMAAGNFALSDFRVFGKSDGTAPTAVRGLEVKRAKTEQRDGLISWESTPNAYGYNIYYGVEPKKLYNCITVYNATSYDFRGMDVGTDYYFAIEALGEAGISPRSKTIKR